MVAFDVPGGGESADDAQAVISGESGFRVTPRAAAVLDLDPGLAADADLGAESECRVPQSGTTVPDGVGCQLRRAKDQVIFDRAVVQQLG
jgi:hypothetical protein